jgi:3-deoxy-D-manno-octulosonate 8-phosphate phosphatase (KDO 8-P phosphatase)
VTAPPEWLAKLRAVRLLAMDVDGVLTDGGLYYTDAGDETKRFHVMDGHGLVAVLKTGIEIAWITGGKSRAVLHRAERLGIKHVFSDVVDKLRILNQLCETLRVPLAEVAYVGDDIPDLPVLRAVACPLSVANADSTVRAAAMYVTTRRGGDGAIREICDLLLGSRAEQLEQRHD